MRSRARAGFTLVEVTVALVLAGVVALAVAGSVSAALDTRSRLESRRLEIRSRLAWRGIVGEALRNARAAAAPGDTAFLLLDGTLPDGQPGDRLAFLAAGVTPPLSAGLDWVVSLAPAVDGSGVRLTASPVGVRAAPTVLAAPHSVTGVQIEVLGPDGRWVEEWTRPFVRPTAVRITYWSAAGPAGPPWTVALPAVEAEP